MAGHADVILAGGVETLSDVPILHTRKFSQILAAASKARSLGDRLGLFAQVRAA
jgi:acetyl-CoA acyltransferase